MSGCEKNELIIEDGVREISLAVFSVDTLNPIETKSESVREITSFMYDSLFSFDKSLKAEPCLAESLTVSPDGLTAAITLKKDISWNSGFPLTANDVVYTINMIKSNGGMYADNVSDIASAVVNSDTTLTVSFYSPQMNPEALFSFPIIRDGSYQVIDATPDGTGMYMLSVRSSHKIVLQNKSTPTSLINISIMHNSFSCLNAFESREVDFLTPSTVDLFENTPAGEIDIHEYTSNRFTFLGFNNSIPKYSEPYIKIAINTIIDRNKLTAEALLGKATPTVLPINPSAWFYSVADGPEMDIDGAMEKAGYKKINGKYMSDNGEKAEINILVSQNDRKKMAVAENIRQQLETAGFAANVIFEEYNSYLSMIEKGEFDLFIGEVNMRDNLDPGFLTEASNMFFYANSELSDVVYKMRTSDDLISAITEYERIFSVNPPFVPLYYVNDAIITRNTLSGITEPNFYNTIKNADMIYVSSKEQEGE